MLERKLCGLRALRLLDIDSLEDVETPLGVSRSLVRLVMWTLGDHNLQVQGHCEPFGPAPSLSTA